jgi:hypothetical protein
MFVNVYIVQIYPESKITIQDFSCEFGNNNPKYSYLSSDNVENPFYILCLKQDITFVKNICDKYNFSLIKNTSITVNKEHFNSDYVIHYWIFSNPPFRLRLIDDFLSFT